MQESKTLCGYSGDDIVLIFLFGSQKDGRGSSSADGHYRTD